MLEWDVHSPLCGVYIPRVGEWVLDEVDVMWLCRVTVPEPRR